MAGEHHNAHKYGRSHHNAHLHPLTNVPTKCQPPTPYRIQQPRQAFKLIQPWSKVKARSQHDVAYLQPLINVPNKYQLPTSYNF